MNNRYYYFDSDNVFTHSEPAQPDHRAGGYLAPPANATFVATPQQELPPNRSYQFFDGGWNVVDDYRFTKFWLKNDRSEVRLQIGETPNEELTTIEPKPNQVWNNDGWVDEPNVPQSITPRQARLILADRGLLTAVESLINSLDEGKARAQIEWQYATSIDRNSVLVGMICGEMDLTPEQIDDLFIEASKL